MSKLLHTLIIEDNESDALRLVHELQCNGFEVNYTVVNNPSDMEAILKEQACDIILSDFSLADFDTTQALKILQQQQLDIPFIVISDRVGEDVAVAAMKAGAQDFITKDKLTRLTPAIEREVRDARERHRRREVEAQFYQSEDRFAKAFHGSPIGIAISRISDGKAIDINDRFTEMFGFKREDIIGKSASELNLWSDNEQRKHIVQELQATGSVSNVEVRLQRASGEEGYALLSAEIIELHGESCILSMVYDITARKQAEEEIKRSNDLMGLMRDIAVAANEADDVEAILQFTIDRICAYTGWDVGHAYIVPENGIEKLNAPPVWHISDDECFKAFQRFTETTFDASDNPWINSALQSSEIQWIEDLSQTEDFVRADVAISCGLRSAYAFPIISHQKVTGIFEFFSTDKPDNLAREIVDLATQVSTQVGQVIERQRAQAALRENEERYRALFDHSMNAVYIHDLKGNFIDANSALLDLIGYKREDLEGLNVSSVLIPADVKRAYHHIKQTIEARIGSVANEYRVTRSDGTICDIETIASVIYRNNQPWAIQGIARNITERNRAHELERIRRRFAEALLNTATDVLMDNLDLDTILDHILNHAGELTPCDTASLMIVEDNTARVTHCYEFPEEHIPEILNIEVKVSEVSNFHTMAITRKPLLIQDTQKYAGWREDILANGMVIKSYIGAPIFVGDRLFGFINLDATETNRFTLDHVEQLAILASQAAVAIHNAQLYEQIQQYTKRLELLHQIDQAILRADNPKAIGHAVLPRLQTLLNIHSASITLFDLENGEYRVLATTSTDLEYLSEGSHHEFENLELLETLEHNEIHIIDDLSDYLSGSPINEAFSSVGIRSHALIPLVVGGRLLGSINFRATEPYYFTAEKLDIAREVSAQIAIAIENARLLEVEQRHNSELTALHQASLQLTRTFDLNSVFDIILDYAILLINTNDAHIFLYDGEKLSLGAAQWDHKKQKTALAEPRPDGLTYRVAQTAQRMVIPNMQEHPLYSDSSHSGAIIGLPLRIGDTVVGVMTLGFNDTHHFEEQELRILELLADQAAIALHNTQLYEQIKLHNEELEQRVEERTVELKQAKDRVEAILHNSSDAIILTDGDGKIYQTNTGFDSQLGYDIDELFKQPLHTIVDAEYVEQVNAAVQNVREQAIAQRIEIVVKPKNQTTFPADVLVAPFREGDHISIVCSLRNISLQKQVEDELRKALEKEKELNELKTNFTSIVSHEFRTPLAVILSSTDMLNHYYDRMTQDRRQQKFNTIIKQVHRLTGMIDDILMITRSETIGFECNPQSINLIALCKELFEEAQIRHWEDGVTIDFTHPDIPESVIVDEFLFSHILQNLASNAVKYSHKDGNVYVSLNIEEDELVLQVEDKGIGMPESYKSKLFESFQRGSNVADIQGTGIGLTIVKRAVDAHGGVIRVESQEGIGTTFTIKLPITKERVSEN